MRKTFIEAELTSGPQKLLPPSLPLMRKTFIEAYKHKPSLPSSLHVSSAYAEDFHWGAAPASLTRVTCGSLFRLCGRLSLRQDNGQRWQHLDLGSLPLMRKTFIEAKANALGLLHGFLGLFRLCGRLSLRHREGQRQSQYCPASLPLMRKTFIEAS